MKIEIPKEQKILFSDIENFRDDCNKAIKEGYVIHQILKDNYARYDSFKCIKKGYWILLYKY